MPLLIYSPPKPWPQPPWPHPPCPQPPWNPCAEAAVGTRAMALREAAAISPRVTLRSIVVLQFWREAVVVSLLVCRSVLAARSSPAQRIVFPACFAQPVRRHLSLAMVNLLLCRWSHGPTRRTAPCRAITAMPLRRDEGYRTGKCSRTWADAFPQTP